MTPREPERTATAAELADERAKLDRAASGAWRDVAAEARLDRIRALTPGQCREALIYMSGYEPQGVDYALASIADRAPVTGGGAGESGG